MAGARQPVQLVQANGRKHLTQEEIARRMREEIQPCTDNITAPSYLTPTQRKQFDQIAGQLSKLGIMGETDCDTLARYITAQALYEAAVRDLRAVRKDRPKGGSAAELAIWASTLEDLDKRIDRYFKQAHTAATALGLTISSRCKLAVPNTNEQPQRLDKFARFAQ